VPALFNERQPPFTWPVGSTVGSGSLIPATAGRSASRSPREERAQLAALLARLRAGLDA
jgi:hypothetical protein